MDNILNGLTSNEILNDENILKYEKYEINCIEEPDTIGIATHYVNGRKVWYIYEIDSFKTKSKIYDYYNSFREVITDAREYILGKAKLQEWINSKLEEKRKKRLEEKMRIDKMIDDYIKEYKKIKQL